MSSTTFYSTIGTANTVEHLRTSYNNVAAEFSSDVLRVPGSATQTGNLTLNGTFIAQTVTLSSAIASNTTNRLENRNGVLFFNNARISTDFNVVYGYVAGGINASAVRVTSSERFTFSTGTSATQTPVLSQARSTVGGLSDTKTFGYFGGGTTGVAVATSDRITFATSAIAAHTPTNLSAATRDHASISDGVVYGYYLGGLTGSVSVAKQDRVTFATEALAAHTPGNLTTARQEHTGLSDGSIYGYIAGGRTTAASNAQTSTERITFSTSVCASSTVVLSVSRIQHGSLSDVEVYGYISGGYSGTGTTAIATTDRVTFSSGAIAAHTPANVTANRVRMSGMSDGNIYGYYHGGLTGSAAVVTCDRITFSTSVLAAYTIGNLTSARREHAALTDATV